MWHNSFACIDMMEKINKQAKGIKIFGIDSIIIIRDDSKNVISPKENRNHYVMDFTNSSSLRRALKEAIRNMNTTPDKIIGISAQPKAIKALKRAGVAMVFGLRNENNSRKEMYDQGADYVLDSLAELELVEGIGGPFRFSQELQGAFQFVNNEALHFSRLNPVFFFDYDGTLAPIVKDPKQAHLSDSVRILLRQLSEHYPVAIVSGRDLQDVRKFVQLDHLTYAGSHGFRIAGPGGISWTHSEAEKTIPMLDQVEKRLKKEFAAHQGIQVERKYSALAIHYRNAPKHSYRLINQVVDKLISEMPDFRKGRGKKIVEIKPAFDWNKGKAVEWILRKMGYADPDEYLPVYVGDDITDEDAFKALADHGITILVGDHGGISAADMKLRDCWQVEELLHVLVQEAILEKQKSQAFSYL